MQRHKPLHSHDLFFVACLSMLPFLVSHSSRVSRHRFSPRSVELWADQPGNRHVVHRSSVVCVANGMFSVRRWHEAGNVLQHQPMSPRFPRRSVRRRVRGSARSHAQANGQGSKVSILTRYVYVSVPGRSNYLRMFPRICISVPCCTNSLEIFFRMTALIDRDEVCWLVKYTFTPPIWFTVILFRNN